METHCVAPTQLHVEEPSITARTPAAHCPPADAASPRLIMSRHRRRHLDALGVLGAHLQSTTRHPTPPAPAAPPRAALAAGRRRTAFTPADFKRRLVGPILSLPTTFNADLSVDYEAVSRMVRRARRFGVEIFELTAGNSKYHVLSYEEIKGVTRAMVEAAGE